MTGTHATQCNMANVHRLEITSEQLQQIVDHVREWLPFEGCGLIATSNKRVTRIYPGTNVARSSTFYEMDPKQVLAAMRDIDDKGLRLGAIFHSHPSTEAYPSLTDLELIFDPEVYMIIISLSGEEPDVRTFRYDGEISEVPLIVVDRSEGDG
jgi:[CysO sulfur-carrier protein]-S-L-cysteine hydrolase